MIEVTNFPDAYKEVYTILQYVDFEDIKLIDQNFIDMLRSNMNRKHNYLYNPEVKFEKQKMLRETKAILAYIYINYWADAETKEIISAKYKQELLELEREKNIKYPVENVFHNKPNKKQSDTNVSVVPRKDAGLIKRIFNRLKKIFIKE